MDVEHPLPAIEASLKKAVAALRDGLLRIVRAVREQVDWPSLRRRTHRSPHAAAFFVLCEELGILDGDARGPRGADVRVLTPRAGIDGA